MKKILCWYLALLPHAALAVTEAEADAQAGLLEGPRLDRAIGVSAALGRWTHRIDLVYDPDGAPVAFERQADVRAALEEAIETWEAVAGIDFEYLGADRDALDDRNADSAGEDGVVRIFWEPLDSGLATWSTLSFGGPVADMSHLEYDDGSIALTAVTGVLSTHEALREALVNSMGFLLGLGRSENPNSVRYENPANFLRYPREDDIRALRVLYGPGTFGDFDPARPVAEWQFEPPPAASQSARLNMFRANQVSPTGARFMNGGEEVTRIDTDAADGSLDFDTGGIGTPSNPNRIDIAAELVLVDPYGYEHHRVDWNFSCPARQACGSVSIPIAEVAHLKTLPGYWRVYVLDASSGWAARRLLHTAEILVTAETDINHAPEVMVRALPGLEPGTVTFVLAATDADDDAISVLWHPPGIGLIYEELGEDGLAVQTIDFGLAGEHSMFVELIDDGERYGSDQDTVANTGFQTLVRLDVKLPLEGPADFTALSSANAEATYAGTPVPASPDVLAAIVAQAQALAAVTPTGAASSARLRLNASPDGGTSTGSAFTADANLLVAGGIEPEPADLGAPADIFVVVRSLLNSGAEIWNYRDQDGRLRPWNLRVDGLQPAHASAALATAEVVEAYAGYLPPGLHLVYLGYRVRGESTLHHNGTPFSLVVTQP